MDRVPCGQCCTAKDDLPGSFDYRSIHREYLIDNSQQRIKCRLNGIPPRDGNVAVEDFLQRFSVSDEPLTVTHQFLQPAPCIGLVRMGRADQIHGNIRVDKGHG